MVLSVEPTIIMSRLTLTGLVTDIVGLSSVIHQQGRPVVPLVKPTTSTSRLRAYYYQDHHSLSLKKSQIFHFAIFLHKMLHAGLKLNVLSGQKPNFNLTIL